MIAYTRTDVQLDLGTQVPIFGRIVQKLKAALRSVIGARAYAAIARRKIIRSETSRHRVLAKFCAGNGVDIGFGGDPITPSATRMDLPSPYTSVGRAPVQLGGDCRDLHWFGDNALDYVYSSHVPEDFAETETMSILREWTTVLRPGRRLVLLLPDQQRYLAHCHRVGELNPDGIVGNPHYSIPTFSLRYVDAKANELGTLRKIDAFELLGPYSFAVVYEKEK